MWITHSWSLLPSLFWRGMFAPVTVLFMDQIDKLKKRIADVTQARAKEKNKQERNNKTTERKRNTIPHILE